jgi:hypothetical protein
VRDDYFDQAITLFHLSLASLCANCVIVLLPVLLDALTECVCVLFDARYCKMLHAGVIALDVYSMTFHNAPATAAWCNINTKIQRTFKWMHTQTSRAHKRGGTLNSAGAQGINFSAMTAVNLFCLLQAIKFDVHFNLKCKYAVPEAFRTATIPESSLFSRS